MKRMNPFKNVNFCDMKVLRFIVVYFRPSDYPKNYVARLWEDQKPTDTIVLGDSLEEIRSFIPGDLVSIPRDNKDEPCIVETWI